MAQATKGLQYEAVNASARIVYRAMREDPAGGPQDGPTALTLGVRPNVDLPVVAGQVHAGTGGLSVAPDSMWNLHPLRRPPAYGGLGKDPVWWIDIGLLGSDLIFRQDSSTHGVIEPARDMAIDALQKALAATKYSWKKLP